MDEEEYADNTDLLIATKKKKDAECKAILQEGKTNVDTREKETKRTALHYAACIKKSKILQLLLNYNASCNVQDSQGNTPLHLAIEKKSLNCCKVLLNYKNLEVNLVNEEKNTPLHLAAQYGLEDVVDRLLELEADCNASNASGNTPLHLAAKGSCSDDKNTPWDSAKKGTNYPQVVALLMSHNADCNAKNSSEETPLHRVIIGGDFNSFQEIMKYEDIDVKSPRTDGFTPLHCATKRDNVEIIKQLLSRGADCNAKSELNDTPLHLAVTKGNLSCCEELLKCADLKVNEKNKNQEAPLHLAAKMGRGDICNLILQHKKEEIDINIEGKRLKTPLHSAAQSSNDDVVKVLLENGAEWRCKDKQHYLPLHYAAEKGCVESCQLLVDKFNEAEDKEMSDLILKDKKTPLMLAAKNGHYKCCKLLIFQNIDAEDADGNNALFYAIEGGFLKTVRALVDHGADAKYKNKDDRTVLHQAAKAKTDKCFSYLLGTQAKEYLSAREKKHGFTPLLEAINNEALTYAKLLLDHNASTEVVSKEGMTPLHLAAQKGDPGLCSLLSSKKKVNMKNNDGQTPLHLAAMNGHKDACMVLLMTKGIEVMDKDRNNDTALHLAAKKGREQVLKLIMKVKGVKANQKNDDSSTALHLAAYNGHQECCEILVTKNRRLVFEVDGKGKLALDVAFEENRDDVFAYLMRNFKPPKNDSFKTGKWIPRLHDYMHQSLQREKPRE